MAMEKRAPVLFCGHGSPMNAIDPTSRARKGWRAMGERLGKPRAIVAISAHWVSDERTLVRRSDENPQINDMYGFPEALYRVKYEPAGSIELAGKVLAALEGIAEEDNFWGIDHGAWSVLCNMYPGADVPVVMVSTNQTSSPQQMFELGRRLRPLRDEGAMVFASGNVVHNLGLVDWDNPAGAPWADAFDQVVRDAIMARDYQKVVEYELLPNWRLAIPTVEHYLPLLAALGAAHDDDRVEVFNEYRELASMSMTSYLFESA